MVFWWSRVRFRVVRFQLFLLLACLVLRFVLEWNLDGAGWTVVFTSLVRGFFLRDLLSLLFKLLSYSDLKLTSRLSASTGRPTNIRTARWWWHFVDNEHGHISVCNVTKYFLSLWTIYALHSGTCVTPFIFEDILRQGFLTQFLSIPDGTWTFLRLHLLDLGYLHDW